MATYKVGTMIGSLSSTSINRIYYNALRNLAPQAGLELHEIPIKDLPLYSQDYDDAYPAEALALKSSIAEADGILIVSPEFNRSIPGGLKNAIDWASRPWGQSIFPGKPTAVTGTSPGAIATSLGQRAIREVLAFLNAPTLLQPEVYLQFKPGLITDNGEVSDTGTTEFLTGFLQAFHDFIAAHKQN